MDWGILGVVLVGVAVIAYFNRDRIARELRDDRPPAPPSRPKPTYTPEQIAAATSKGPTRREVARPATTELDTSSGAPRCPNCGGVQFKARRTAGQRAKIGTAAVLSFPISAGAGGLIAAKAVKQRVQCITCGTFYERIGTR